MSTTTQNAIELFDSFYKNQFEFKFASVLDFEQFIKYYMQVINLIIDDDDDIAVVTYFLECILNILTFIPRMCYNLLNYEQSLSMFKRKV